MALTSQQDIPEKPKTQESWSFKRLFPFAGAMTSLTKVFINPFDVMLAYLILVLGVAVLIGRDTPWVMLALTVLMLCADLVERYFIAPLEGKKEKK